MSRNMFYINYINSLVDYEKYFSYGDVMQAVSRGELFLEPPEYIPEHVCIECGEEILYNDKYLSNSFCSTACYNKWRHRNQTKAKRKGR